jgi:cell volume regulation protein A
VTREVILTLGLLLVAGLIARLLVELTRLPEIVFLLALGALLGPSALDVVDVGLRSQGAQLIFTLGVSAILFYGGLSLSLDTLRGVWMTLGLLAIPGVLLTAVVVGAVASVVLDLPFKEGLLIGAVLAPTDPAILIPLFIGTRLRAKVAQTVVAESALNDPTGAIVALAVAGALLSGESSISGPAVEFLAELGMSTVVGVLAGVLLSAAISSRRAGILRDSVAIAVLAVVALSYVSLDSAGGSGYLGAFAAGLIVGNMRILGLAMHDEHERDLAVISRALADVVTIFVFVLLGANLPFEAIGDRLLPLLAVVAVLVLVARPLTVLVCTLPDRRAAWTRRELAFLCWTRETGVVPAALVGVLAGLGVPGTDVLAAVVAVAILTTLAVQAAPARWLAARLGLLEPHAAEGMIGVAEPAPEPAHAP